MGETWQSIVDRHASKFPYISEYVNILTPNCGIIPHQCKDHNICGYIIEHHPEIKWSFQDALDIMDAGYINLAQFIKVLPKHKDGYQRTNQLQMLARAVRPSDKAADAITAINYVLKNDYILSTNDVIACMKYPHFASYILATPHRVNVIDIFRSGSKKVFDIVSYLAQKWWPTIQRANLPIEKYLLIDNDEYPELNAYDAEHVPIDFVRMIITDCLKGETIISQLVESVVESKKYFVALRLARRAMRVPVRRLAANATVSATATTAT